MPTSAPEVGEVEEGFSSVVAAAGVKQSQRFVCLGEKEKKGKRFRWKTRAIYGLAGRRGSTADCCKAREWPPLSSTTWGVKRRVPSRGVEPQRVPGNPRVLNHARLLPGWPPHSCLVCSTGGSTRASLLATLSWTEQITNTALTRKPAGSGPLAGRQVLEAGRDPQARHPRFLRGVAPPLVSTAVLVAHLPGSKLSAQCSSDW